MKKHSIEDKENFGQIKKLKQELKQAQREKKYVAYDILRNLSRKSVAARAANMILAYQNGKAFLEVECVRYKDVGYPKVLTTVKPGVKVRQRQYGDLFNRAYEQDCTLNLAAHKLGIESQKLRDWADGKV